MLGSSPWNGCVKVVNNHPHVRISGWQDHRAFGLYFVNSGIAHVLYSKHVYNQKKLLGTQVKINTQCYVTQPTLFLVPWWNIEPVMFTARTPNHDDKGYNIIELAHRGPWLKWTIWRRKRPVSRTALWAGQVLWGARPGHYTIPRLRRTSVYLDLMLIHSYRPATQPPTQTSRSSPVLMASDSHWPMQGLAWVSMTSLVFTFIAEGHLIPIQ